MSKLHEWHFYVGASLYDASVDPVKVTVEPPAAQALHRCEAYAWATLLCAIGIHLEQ